MKHKSLLLAITTLTLTVGITNSFSHLHSTFIIKEFKILNYTNTIPTNPIFIAEISYFLKECGCINPHNKVKLSIKANHKTQTFTIGEDVLFNRLSQDKIKLFLPFPYTLPQGKNQTVSFTIFEGKKATFKTNISFQVSKNLQHPIIISEGLREIEIPRTPLRQIQFFFVYHSPCEAMITKIGSKTTNFTISQQVARIKGLHFIEYNFSEEGEYLIKVGESEFTSKVSFDKTPPTFKFIFPTNNSAFYRTNKIKLKWSDPMDISDIDFSNSSLVISKGKNVLTNISPLIGLNRESERNPYEVVYLSLPEGDYECSIRYKDTSCNLKNEELKFRVSPSELDREKPFFRRIEVENSVKVSEGKFRVKDSIVSVFVEFSDGEYGSGVKRIHYKLNGELVSEDVFDEVKYLSLQLKNKVTKVAFWLEDLGGNFSETNIITLVK
ncbi:MAG: Ig-like domain-containing protein [Brevinematia bacterium]